MTGIAKKKKKKKKKKNSGKLMYLLLKTKFVENLITIKARWVKVGVGVGVGALIIYAWVVLCRQNICLEWGCFIRKQSGKGFKYTRLESGSRLFGKRVVNYLSLERGHHKWICVNDMKRQR